MAATTYHIGDQPKVTTTFTVDGVATTPTTYTALCKAPDGGETELTPVVSATGVLVTTLPELDQAGTWYWRVAGESGVVAADEGGFHVRRSHFTEGA